MIIEIDFETILDVWKNKLWPTRNSMIESSSAMSFLGGYDTNNMKKTPTFLSYQITNKIVGVNSIHECDDHGFRSRGLYVDPNYRRKGIGKELLRESIEKSSNYIWSYPKQESWHIYKSVGFELSSDWHQSELGMNAYCRLNLSGAVE
jgi:L-amino acid N-acyltransferase YncA